jgi:hypothetical protein
VTTPRPRRSLAAAGPFIAFGTKGVDIGCRGSGELAAMLSAPDHKQKEGVPKDPLDALFGQPVTGS